MRLATAAISMLSLALLSACGGFAPSAAAAPSIEDACVGLPDAVMDRTLADVRSSVASVEPHREGGAKLTPRLIGAVVQVRATPGLTAEWLGRVLQCDAARQAPSAACGPSGCPLTPAGASADVTSTRSGFAVALRARDPELAREIEHRARGFARPAQPSAGGAASMR